ncbi:MAG: hypothetical protein DMD62_11240, partial [Gemmatimonadetes bacterium]
GGGGGGGGGGVGPADSPHERTAVTTNHKAQIRTWIIDEILPLMLPRLSSARAPNVIMGAIGPIFIGCA